MEIDKDRPHVRPDTYQRLPTAPLICEPQPVHTYGSTAALAGGYYCQIFTTRRGSFLVGRANCICTPLWVLASLRVRSAIAWLMFE